MSVHDRPPLSRELAPAAASRSSRAETIRALVRQALVEELERLNIVGAQPWSVDYGQAAGLTRAYAARVNDAVEEMNNAVKDWTTEKVEADKALTPDERNFLFRDWQVFYAQWNAHFAQVNTFDIFGMTTEEAWQKTSDFEARLKALRATFATLTTDTATKPPPDPGSLEQPKGAPSPKLGDDIGSALGGIFGAIPWGWIIGGAVVVGGGLYVLSRSGR